MSARVLVVHHDRATAALLEAKLAREYFDVSTAPDGEAALRRIAEAPPDVVLLSAMMPDLDGLEVCRRIKADPCMQAIPVVITTALSAANDRVRGLEAGADDFLTFPIDDAALSARIRSLVRLKLLTDEWRMRGSTADRLGLFRGDDAIAAEHGSILLVDDNPNHVRRLESTLAGAGHAVTVTPTVDGALEAASRRDFDVVIVDLHLRSGDGLRACSRCRSHGSTRHTPILLLVDDADVPVLAKAFDVGITDTLALPADRNEILARTRTQVVRKRTQERLHATVERNLALAVTDALTGLANRRYLETHLANLLGSGRQRVGVLMIDVDRFKEVNDGLGHASGDEVLRELAHRLAASVRDFDLVARTGGDEFVVVVSEATPEIVAAIAERVWDPLESTCRHASLSIL